MARHNLRRSDLLDGGALANTDLDPMGSMGNLMDVMLVFATGLLLALVANWNVDLASSPTKAQESGTPAITEIDSDLQRAEDGIAEGMENFEQMGTVYRNKDTDQLYVVTPN